MLRRLQINRTTLQGPARRKNPRDRLRELLEGMGGHGHQGNQRAATAHVRPGRAGAVRQGHEGFLDARLLRAGNPKSPSIALTAQVVWVMGGITSLEN